MTTKRSPIEVTIPFTLPYEWNTSKYGRAEFQLCAVFKRGKFTDLYIDRRQQVLTSWYHLEVDSSRATGLWFSSYIPGSHFPYVWQTTWCKEHRCHSLELYVPDNSRVLEVTYGVGKVHLSFTSPGFATPGGGK